MQTLSWQIQSLEQGGQVSLLPQLSPMTPHHCPPTGVHEVTHFSPLEAPAFPTLIEPPVDVEPPVPTLPPLLVAGAPEAATLPPVLNVVPAFGLLEQALARANTTQKACARPR